VCKTIGGHKMCRDRHDFILLSLMKYARIYCRFLTRHFIRPSPAIFTITRYYPLCSISLSAVTGQANQNVGCYGASQSERR